jgi:hypothetical protein
VIGDDAVHRFADFQALLRVLQNLSANFGKTKAPRGALEEAYSELIFEVGNTAAHAGERHLQSTRGFGKALRLYDSRKYHQRVEVAHHHPISEKVYSTIWL